jgi:hypothetical protein
VTLSVVVCPVTVKTYSMQYVCCGVSWYVPLALVGAPVESWPGGTAVKVGHAPLQKPKRNRLPNQKIHPTLQNQGTHCRALLPTQPDIQTKGPHP